MTPRLSLILTAMLAAATPAGAQSAPPPPQSPPLPTVAEQVVVTASRQQELVKNLPMTITVVTADEIRQSSATTVDALLRRVAGFSLIRQGSSISSHPSLRATTLRGLGGARTLVLVDGIPVNNPVSGIVNWPAISLDNIERIEIVKNGASGVWGNLAMAGVINIITKTAKPGAPAVSIRAQGGTQQTGQFFGGVQHARGPLSVSAAASYLTTGGYKVIRADQVGPIDRNVSDAIKTFDAALEYRSAGHGTWSAGGNLFGENQNYGTPLNVDSTGGGSAHLSGEFATAGGSRWRVSGFGTRQQFHAFASTIAVDRKSETPSTNQFALPGVALGTGVQWTKPVNRAHLLSAGSDVQWIDATINEDFTYSAALAALTRQRIEGGRQGFAALFLDDMYQMSDRVRLMGGLRLDAWQTIGGTRRETDIATGNVLRDDTYVDTRMAALNPTLGVLVHASKRVTLRGSLARAFRVPTAAELYRPFRARGNQITESNAFLRPERLLAADAGVETSIGRGFTARVTGFWDRVDDQIINATIAAAGATSKTIDPCGVVPAFGSCRQVKNAGRLRSTGVEMEIAYTPAPAFEISLSYMFNRSVTAAAPGQPQLLGKFNRQAPEHSGALQIVCEHPRVLDLSVQLRFASHRFEDDINTIRVTPFAQLDLTASRAISPRSEAYLTVQNVTDRVNELTHTDDGTVNIVGPRQVNAGLRFRF